MKVLLISTYELGRQPVHLASPAASLEAQGFEVRTLDLAVSDLELGTVDDIEAVAISVPMHTATRLALAVARRIKARRPDLPVALYGLYAGIPSDVASVDAKFEGEYEPALIDWVAAISKGSAPDRVRISHRGRSSFEVPRRSDLPPLDRYARLEHDGRARLAGAVEASHGCRHRCRHCPIPSVYDGRLRVVPKHLVLTDIERLVSAGAEHITFGDADFLNAPKHSLEILEAAHEAHPDLTFDATVKVEHILQHREIWPDLASLGLLFIVSAFESVDDQTLEILDKGHTRSDMIAATEIIRSAGMHIRPTWLPFLPWTEPGHVAEIFRFIASQALVSATDPVQMAIKLLIPRGSLLEDHPSVVPHLDGYDDSVLSWVWSFKHPETELLQKELDTIAARASDCGQESLSTLLEMREAVERITGEALGELAESQSATPRLTESWFCCAEPTDSQYVNLGIGPV